MEYWGLTPVVGISKEGGSGYVPGPETFLRCCDFILSGPCLVPGYLSLATVSFDVVFACVQSVWGEHVGEGDNLKMETYKVDVLLLRNSVVLKERR